MNYHHYPQFLILLLLVTAAYSCEQLEFSEDLNFPVTTIELLASEDGQFTVRGEVIAQRGSDIETVFLNWYPPGKHAYLEESRYLEPVDYVPGNPFTATIDRDLISDQDYQVRFVYRLASGERIFSPVVTASTTVAEPGPMEEVAEFSRILATTTDDFKVKDGQFTLIADNARYIFDGTNFLAVNDIPNGDIPVQVLFQNSSNVNYLVEIDSITLYTRSSSPGNRTIWQHIRGSTTVTLLGEIPTPLDIKKAGNRIFFRRPNREIWELILEPELRIERINDVPANNISQIRDVYFAANDNGLFLLIKRNPSVLGTERSTLQLLRYDLGSDMWEELPAPPGSSDGYLWISAEPNRLLFGGEETGSVKENDIWLLDYTTNDPWKFIGWLPSEVVLKEHPPRFIDGKHFYIGINSNIEREPAYLYSIDLSLLEDL